MGRRTATIDAEGRATRTRDSGTPGSARRPLLDLRPANRMAQFRHYPVKPPPNQPKFLRPPRPHRGRSVSRRVNLTTPWGRSGESYYGRLEILVKRLRDKLGVAHE